MQNRTKIELKTLEDFINVEFSKLVDKEQGAIIAKFVVDDVSRAIETKQFLSLQSGQYLYRITESLLRKDILKNIADLKQNLKNYFNQLLSTNDAERFSQQAADLVADKVEEPLYSISIQIADQAYQALTKIHERKRTPDYVEFRYEIMQLIDNYFHQLKSSYQSLKDKINIKIESILSAYHSDLAEQEEAYQYFENELLELLDIKLKDFLPDLHKVSEEQVQMIIDNMPFNLTREETFFYLKEKTKEIKDRQNNQLKAAMDIIISEWSRDKPGEFTKLIDFDQIKSMKLLDTTLASEFKQLEKTLKDFSFVVAPLYFAEDDFKLLKEKLQIFLVDAQGLEMLVGEKLPKLDAKDHHLYDAANDFRTVILNMPPKLQRAFVNQEFNPQTSIDQYDIESWHPNTIVVTALENPDLLSNAKKYAELYQVHLQKLKQTQQAEQIAPRQSHIAALASKPQQVDMIKVNSLFNAIKKGALGVFQTMVTKCNLVTLETLKLKLKDIPENRLNTQMIKMLNERMIELESGRISTEKNPSLLFSNENNKDATNKISNIPKSQLK